MGLCRKHSCAGEHYDEHRRHLGGPIPGITPITPPNAQVGISYDQRILGNSGTPSYVYTTVASLLPAGLTLSSAGRLSGTPTSSLAHTFTVRATDTIGCFSERQYTLLFGVLAPTLPQVLFVVLGIGVMAIGYFRLRRPAPVRR